MKKLKFIIGNDGTVKIDAEGFQGNECDKVIQPFLQVLSKERPKEILKPEYHQPVKSISKNEQANPWD